LPYYLNPNINGLLSANSNGDGYSITLKWATAYPTIPGNKIAYNIYGSSDIAPDFSTEFFNVSPILISLDGYTSVKIIDLTPGQPYHFAVRAAEYDPLFFDLHNLPSAYSNLYVYPQSPLAEDITTTSSIISLIDTSDFPQNSSGTVKIGSELINYSSISGNNLILTNISLQRGFNNTVVNIHNTDGYDGYVYWSPVVIFWPVQSEEQNTKVFECWNRFDINQYAFTITDGYKQITKDILTTDTSGSDAINTGFPAYDFSGYHRTDPALILSGACIGSYIGGQTGCADSNTGVGMQVRGISIQDANTQRQEVLLSLTGEPVCLVNREWTGITCYCMLPSSEYPDARCLNCMGTGIVLGWKQFFDPRRSDGRIMVRFDPTVDDLVSTDSGLESTLQPNCWTLTVPTLKDRDFIVRFDEIGNEEFRYEILNVTRNKTLLNNTGAQKFVAQRIRKTDIIYQVNVFRNTAQFPRTLTTGISNSLGIPSHSHTFVVNEGSIVNMQQLTGVAAGHQHQILIGQDGKLYVSTVVGHSHTLTFP
jgi:hypothetical protein